MTKLMVVASGLTKKYGDFLAVAGTNFSITAGECFGFLGPNGAGKTTTIKMIQCISPVTAGELTVAGMKADINNREIKKLVGIIPQEINLDQDLTVYENLLLFAGFFDLPRPVVEERIKELLDFVELKAKLNNRIDELSTGMKRRLQIARALINQPKIIIADEPTTGLDPQARHLIWQRLRDLKKRGATLILTTQYMEEAEQLCDQLVIMHKGKTIKEGNPTQLISEVVGKQVAEIQIETEKDEQIIAHLADCLCTHERVGDTLFIYCQDGQQVMQKLLDLNLPKVIHRPASLEDVFLKLTGRGLVE